MMLRLKGLTGDLTFLDCLCLRCLKCHSAVSWEDCIQHTTEVMCSEDETICFMAHRIFRKAKQQKHQFIKDCYYLEKYRTEDCRHTYVMHVNSSWCERMYCDDHDLCNVGVTPSWKRAYGGQATTKPTRLLTLLMFITGLPWI